MSTTCPSNQPGTLDAYANHWLRLQGECIESAQSGILLIQKTEGTKSQKQWYWPIGQSLEPNYFAPVLNRATLEQKGVVLTPSTSVEEKSSSNNRIHISFPVALRDCSVAVAAFEIQPTGEEQLQRAMRQLQWGMLWLQKFLLLAENTTNISSGNEKPERFKRVFDLLDGTLAKAHCTDAASFLTTELATLLSCDRVTVGLLERNKMKILALSHSAEHQQKTNIFAAITIALEESSDQREIILFPPQESTPGIIYLAHTELAVKYGCGSLLTIPFLDSQGLAYGAILFERDAKAPFNEESVILCEAVATLTGPVLRDKYSHDLSLFRQAMKRTGQHLEKNLGPGNPGKKLAGIAILLCLLFVGLAQGNFQIPAQVTLSGEIQRAVIAPFSGYVNSTKHRAGDHVEKEAVLASLDTSDLTLEQLQWASRKKQADLEYQKAIAGNLTADAKIILERRKQAEIQLSLLELKRERMTITAPFAGLLVQGDLSQSIGAPVERGQVLFELVPDNAFRVILEVDEGDIDFIAVGQDGTLVFNALPHQTFTFAVEKITPVSTPLNGRNTFRVEGKLHKTMDRFRPGMSGYAKIFITEKPLLWIWSRPILDRIKLWFWSSMW